jgi:hypothetical protein
MDAWHPRPPQFFITAGDNLDSLDGRYTIFGEIVDDGSSFETLAKINDAYCDEDGRPYVDIRYVAWPAQGGLHGLFDHPTPGHCGGVLPQERN